MLIVINNIKLVKYIENCIMYTYIIGMRAVVGWHILLITVFGLVFDNL